MPNFLDKYKKFFLLESQRNFDNKAILGGMGKIVDLWQIEASENKIPKSTIETISNILAGYGNLSKDQRKTQIQNIQSVIKEFSDVQEVNIPEKKISKFQTEQISNINKTTISNDQLSGLHSSLTVINGIGIAIARKLAKLELFSLYDLLRYYPRRYDDYSQLKPINRINYGEEITIIGTISSIDMRGTKNRRYKIIEAVIGDGSGYIKVTWFNQPWLLKQLTTGKQISLSGKVDMYLGRFVMTNPDWDFLDQELLHTNRIVPVYPLTSGITQKWLRKVMYSTVSYWVNKIKDYLPGNILQSESFYDLPNALRNIHFPDNKQSLEKAQTRLAFDEIFFLQLGVLSQKRNWESKKSEIFSIEESLIREKINELPFKLTHAQENALRDIREDLMSGHQMNRLLQGDVGSGKTIIARFAIEIIIRNGAQAALIAPTSILAEQHFKTISQMLFNKNSQRSSISKNEIALLIGDTSKKDKSKIREKIANGEVKIVIGTHALLEEPVQFKHLQLVVIDEQHRFGVAQRALIRSKGQNPHLLVMSATPIPRSLALTIYGDLDLSIIDEMPTGRLPINTQVLLPIERERAYQIIESQINIGHQAFIIYPLIESEDIENNQAAVNEYERLCRKVFPQFKIGLMHGRLKPDQKEKIMMDYRAKRFDILVSTTVIEVGMDIPNATVALIEGANRFGLAQLHQIRGRVGRSEHQSYCLLIPDIENNFENERLKIMATTTDGFKLAEFDLKYRGPGEFLGTRQSGYSGLKLASLSDIELIERARNQAQILFKKDPNLENNENQLLAQELLNYWPITKSDIS